MNRLNSEEVMALGIVGFSLALILYMIEERGLGSGLAVIAWIAQVIGLVWWLIVKKRVFVQQQPAYMPMPYPVPYPMAPPPPQPGYTCSGCNAPVTATQTFCPSCGERMG